MRVFEGLGKVPRTASAVTVGNFDGVHRGHLQLIKRLIAQAKPHRAVPTLVTFEPHPQKVLRGSNPLRLASPKERLGLLADAGIERVVVLPFTKKLSHVEPEDFIEQTLVNKLGAKSIVVGRAFRFGHMARGDATMLRSLGRRLGFSFQSVVLSELGGRTVTSTQIRHALSEGDLVWTNKALGRPYRLDGKVVRGADRGKALGFPTANLSITKDRCLPSLGIYAGLFEVGRRRLGAAIAVGTSPTFGKNPVSVEAHVIGLNQTLYGREASIHFLERLRDEAAFPSVDALKEAMADDVRKAARIVGPK